MFRVSPFWLPAHEAAVLRVVCWAEVWSPPGVASANGALIATLAVNGGSVKVDVTNAVRRTLSGIEMVDAASQLPLVPQKAADILFPDGNELIIRRGCLYPNTPLYANAPTISIPWVNGGAPMRGEVVPLGRFLMEGIDVDDAGGTLTVTVASGSDRAETVGRAKFTDPYATGGHTGDVEIHDIINKVEPALATVAGATTVIPATMNWNIGDDPWAACQAIAAVCGVDLAFDVLGVATLESIPNPQDVAPSATFVEGETCTMNELHRKLTNANVPNWIIVQSQGSGIATPLRSDWKDTNPKSPTYIGGEYPVTVDVISTSAATTQGDCDQIAASAGNAAIGQLETDQFTIRGNPALDANDVVKVLRARAGVDGNYIAQQLDIDLAPAGSTVITGRSVIPL